MFRRTSVGVSLFLALVTILLLPSLTAAAGPAASCPASLDWFKGVPALPTAEPQSTCQFQQWAWQAFLALLGGGQGQGKPPLYFTWDFPKPAVFDLYCANVCRSNATMARNPCGGPPTEEMVNATTQPGFVRAGTSGELIDQAGLPVYFTAHISPEWKRFVKEWQLYDPAVLGSQASLRTAFPTGAIEIKSSWRIVDAKKKAQYEAEYYTTEGCVVPEDDSPPFHSELALVGFHITGGVNDHPELVWATFEHVRNAPDCEDTPKAGSWAFYDGKADCATPSTAPCNQPNPTGGTKPINVCRTHPYGGAGKAAAGEIAALNRDVQARLPADSKLRFYELVGTVWGTDPSPKGVVTVNLQDIGGSPLLSNTSLETFKQGVSCFGCHNSQFPAELAGAAGASSIVFQDRTPFLSHVVLFPFFFAPTPCAELCKPTARHPGHVP